MGGTEQAERAGVSRAEYRRLRRAATTYREALVLRLCGEAGLRPPEITRVRPSDFRTASTSRGVHHLLTVRADENGGRDREAYVPPPVRSAVERYVNERGVGPDERLVAVTPRRVQMLLSEVADRAAETADEPRLAEVSPRELTGCYARRLVQEEGLDPRVVLAVGPWEGLKTLCSYLDPVGLEAVLEAFERAGAVGPSADWPPEALGRTVADADLGIVVTDGDGTVEFVNDGFAALTGHSAVAVVGDPAASLYAGDDETDQAADPGRVSLRRADGSTTEVARVSAPLSDGLGSAGRSLAAFAPVERGSADRGAAAPERLTAAIEALSETADVLSAASKRADVAATLCKRLAAGDAYAFAWTGSVTGERGVVSTAWQGVDEATAEALAERATAVVDADADGAGPAPVRVLDGETGAQALADGSRACDVAVVPLTYGDTTHGLLALGAATDGAFGEWERRVLAALGWQVGQAMTDITRRNLLLADSVVELEFRVDSDDAFLARESERLGAAFELQGIVPGESQSLLYFVTVREAATEAVVDAAADADSIDNARLIRDYGDSALVEFVVTGEEPARALTSLGGHVTDSVVEEGTQRITAEFTTETDVRAVFNRLRSSFPASTLFSKQETERPVQTTDGFRRSLEEDLTDKQQSVLRAAYLAGYFEWPRGSTAEELADSIGVSSPTLHNHLRKAQQKVLTAYFDDGGE